MKFGVSIFMTDYALYPDVLAKEAEARGFESLWFPEHTHIPASRKSPYPGGGELPPQYYHSLDPFVALTAAATVTEKIKLGTGIALVIERDPITLAKEVASIDYVRMVDFCSESVVAGTGKKWKIMALIQLGVGSCFVSELRLWLKFGQKMKLSITGNLLISIQSGLGLNQCKNHTHQLCSVTLVRVQFLVL